MTYKTTHKMAFKVVYRVIEVIKRAVSSSVSACCAIALTALLAELHASEQSPSPAQSMAAFCEKLPRPEYAQFDKHAASNDWFEVYQVAPGVTAIYEPHQWQEVISYLIQGDSRALLFDSGNGIGDIAAVVKQLTDKPVQVLNSHGHYDHVGGNYQFLDILGMQTLFTRARQAGQPNQAISIEVSAQALCKDPPAGVSTDNHQGQPYKITQFIRDGHQIDLGGRLLEVIHIPGHTPDAVALKDQANGLLWTGDSYYAGPIWLFAEETDLSEYRDSLATLIEHSNGIKHLLPAHNTPLADPSILPEVLLEFDAMLAGRLDKINSAEGMAEYRSKRDLPFSFLLRDQPLPYEKESSNF